ncbi:MAG: hypothetical protein AAF498_16500 [Pseudomonadota bacterium]
MTKYFVAIACLVFLIFPSADAEENAKFRDIVDDWSTGTWSLVSGVSRSEDGDWESFTTEPYAIEKIGEFAVKFPATGDDAAFSVDFSGGGYEVTILDDSGNTQESYTGEILRADMMGPGNWVFTVKWGDDAEAGMVMMAEAVFTGDTYSWTSFGKPIGGGLRVIGSQGIYTRESSLANE